MTNVWFAKPASFTIRSTLALPVKWGTWNLPPLIASTSGSVDQMKCLTPASLAACTAAVACLNSSVPFSQKLVTRKTPCAPSNAALRVSGRSKSALTTSSARSRCLPGLRLRARTLHWPLACRARTTPPPCCPVAPITAISFFLVDNMSISLSVFGFLPHRPGGCEGPFPTVFPPSTLISRLHVGHDLGHRCSGVVQQRDGTAAVVGRADSGDF